MKKNVESQDNDNISSEKIAKQMLNSKQSQEASPEIVLMNEDDEKASEVDNEVLNEIDTPRVPVHQATGFTENVETDGDEETGSENVDDDAGTFKKKHKEFQESVFFGRMIQQATGKSKPLSTERGWNNYFKKNGWGEAKAKKGADGKFTFFVDDKEVDVQLSFDQQKLFLQTQIHSKSKRKKNKGFESGNG